MCRIVSTIPPTLGKRVVTREVNWLPLVQRAWGSEFTAPDHGVYEFSNGRRFDSTDRTRSGVYGIDVPPELWVDEHYPDMRTPLTTDPEDTPIIQSTGA